MKDICIRLVNVCKDFKHEPVLKGITHDFTAGAIHGIIGNNGSGKTVLFKCICGFLEVTSGQIFVDYERIGKDTDFPPSAGIIIETPGFLPSMTGFRNLQLLASLRGLIGPGEIRKAIRRAGLDPGLRKKVSEYSLGMRQRLGIAQAIMENPSLLILDEPFNGLDKNGIRDMRELLKTLRTEGKTIVLASHNAADIDALCDTVCEMDAGILTVVR